MRRAAICLLVILSLYGSYGAPALQLVEFKSPPQVGTTQKVNPANESVSVRSDPVFLGGFSGITYEGQENGGRGYLFHVTTNRGPTADAVDTASGHVKPFALPEYVPRILYFLVDFTTSTASLIGDMELTQGDGKNMSGLPNLQYAGPDTPFTDDFGVDLFGNIQTNDPLGADFGGLVRANDDTFWLGDSYRPSLFHLDAGGKALNRYIPQGTPTDGGKYGVPLLPAEYAHRRNERGFRAVALQGDILYAFLESPLDNPSSENNGISKNSSNIRILAFDAVKEKLVAQYVYVLSEGVKLAGDAKVDRIGGVASLGNGRFLVVEQDSRSGRDAYKAIYEIELTGASDISDPKVLALLPPNKTIEEVTLDKNIAINPVRKTFIVNLASVGFDYVSVGAITVFNQTSVVVANNNNFQVVESSYTGNGTVTFDRSRSTWFGLVTGLNFTSSSVTTSTTYNPTTGASTTTGKFTTSTTGSFTTTGNSTTTGRTSSSTTSGTSTTNSAASVALDVAALIVCVIALALL